MVAAFCVAIIGFVSGAGELPHYPQGQPGLWIIDALIDLILFPMLILQNTELVPQGPAFVIGSLLWTICVYSGAVACSRSREHAESADK
jgi:hypothetical protein